MEILFRSYELDTANIIIGSYVKENGFYMIDGIPDYNRPVVRHKICDENGTYHEIAPEYLSISFEDMLDSEGNKIFASLQEDGRGGSKLLFNDGKDVRELVCIYNCYTMDLKPIKIIKDSRKFLGATLNEKLKIIGINQ